VKIVGVELALPQSKEAQQAMPLQRFDILYLSVGVYFLHIGNFQKNFGNQIIFPYF